MKVSGAHGVLNQTTAGSLLAIHGVHPMRKCTIKLEVQLMVIQVFLTQFFIQEHLMDNQVSLQHQDLQILKSKLLSSYLIMISDNNITILYKFRKL